MAHKSFPKYKQVQRSRSAILILTIAVVLCIGSTLEANAVRLSTTTLSTAGR